MTFYIRHFRRLVRYGIVGSIAFAIDMALLAAFDFLLGLPYQAAVPSAFLIATSIHYVLVHRVAFTDSERPAHEAYPFFLIIMCGSAAAVTGLVYVLVEYGGLSLYVARVAVSGIVGLVSFYMNTKYNFRIV